MAEQQDIRKAYFNEAKTISEIAKEYGVDRKTVRKYINKEDWNEAGVNTQRASRATVIDPYLPTIERWLIEDKTRRRKQRHTAKRVYTRLVEEEGYTGSYRSVAACVGPLRKRAYEENAPALPLQHIPGEAQVDFGEADYIEHGKRVHGAYLALSFPASNAGFAQLTPAQNQECLFEALIALFAEIGGVPTRIWFDNASTMVTRVLRNGERELTDRFRRFQEHFGFDAAFCNPAAGNEKGNVENKVGYLRRNLLVPEPEFEDLSAFNQQLFTQCRGDLLRSHYREERPICELYKADQAALRPLPRIPFEAARYESLLADGYGMISLEGGKHRYSTAPKFARSRVRVKITAQTVVILDESLREVVTHRRLYGAARQERMEWLPYLRQLSRRPSALKYTPVYEMMPEPLQRWLAAQPRDQVATALELIASLSAVNGFESACRAVHDSLVAGITDADSLVALHDRLSRFAEVLPPPVVSRPTPGGPKVTFDPPRYDELFLGGVQR